MAKLTQVCGRAAYFDDGSLSLMPRDVGVQFWSSFQGRSGYQLRYPDGQTSHLIIGRATPEEVEALSGVSDG